MVILRTQPETSHGSIGILLPQLGVHHQIRQAEVPSLDPQPPALLHRLVRHDSRVRDTHRLGGIVGRVDRPGTRGVSAGEEVLKVPVLGVVRGFVLGHVDLVVLDELADLLLGLRRALLLALVQGVVVDVGAHGLGGVDPFCQGVEEEGEFDLLQERFLLALILARLADVGEPAPLATLEVTS